MQWSGQAAKSRESKAFWGCGIRIAKEGNCCCFCARKGGGCFLGQAGETSWIKYWGHTSKTHVPLRLGLCKPCTNSCFPVTWSLQLIHWCWSPVIKPEALAGVVTVELEGHLMGLATAPAPHGKEQLTTWQPP